MPAFCSLEDFTRKLPRNPITLTRNRFHRNRNGINTINKSKFFCHIKIMAKRFMIFGVLGWCAEILWTGLHSLLAGDGALTAKTYLWMFPIYGLAALAQPLFLALRKYCPLWQRLGMYVFSIFFVEFITGWLLQAVTGACPWDYGDGPFSVMGFIRLDYAPLWALLGYFFEEVSVFLAKEGEMG